MAVYLYGPQSRLWAFKPFSEPPSSCLGLGLLMNLYLRNLAPPGWLTQIVISPTPSQLFLLPRLESPKNRHNLRPFCRSPLAAILLLNRLHGGLVDVPPLACREPPAPLTRLP